MSIYQTLQIWRQNHRFWPAKQIMQRSLKWGICVDREADEHCLLKRVEKQIKEAEVFGFYWTEFSQLIDQIHSECKEIEEAWEKKDRVHLQEEIGDLIQATIDLAVFCQLDPHQTLHKSSEKFQKRYDQLVQLAQRDGLKTLHNQPVEKLMYYWNLAKIEVSK